MTEDYTQTGLEASGELARSPAPAVAQVEPADGGRRPPMVRAVRRRGVTVERPLPSKPSEVGPGTCESTHTGGSSNPGHAAGSDVDAAAPASPAEWAAWLAAAAAVARHPSEWRPPGSDAPAAGEGAPEGRLIWSSGPAEPAPAPPSLDTEGISRQVLASTRLSPADLARAVQLAARTAAYRDILARQHETEGRTRALTDPGREWHLARARGWRNRWGRVVQCGAQLAVIPKCGGCGTADKARAVPVTCDTRECGQCRGARLSQLRAEVLERCDLAASARAYEMAETHNGAGLGRWAWRFATFTIPTGRGIGRDASQVRAAWAAVWRKYREHVKREGLEARAPWAWSSVEATTGVARDGHVHLHVLFLGPYWSAALARRWWGEALATGRAMPTRTAAEVRAYAYAGPYGATVATLASQTRRGKHGRDCAAVAWPVVDIRAVDGAGLGGAVAEVAKYAVKDGWSEYQTPEDLDTLASVYCALARVRLYASSRWLALMVPPAPTWGGQCACESCGTVGWWLADVRPRGPPGHLPEGYRCAPIPHYAADAPRT